MQSLRRSSWAFQPMPVLPQAQPPQLLLPAPPQASLLVPLLQAWLPVLLLVRPCAQLPAHLLACLLSRLLPRLLAHPKQQQIGGQALQSEEEQPLIVHRVTSAARQTHPPFSSSSTTPSVAAGQFSVPAALPLLPSGDHLESSHRPTCSEIWEHSASAAFSI